MKLFGFFLSLFVASFSSAKANSEYYFKPDSGAHALEILYNNMNSPVESENAGGNEVDLESNSNDVIIRYAYGLSESRAAGIYTFFGSREYNSDVSGFAGESNTATGMGDIHLFYEGFIDNWHYEVDWGINTEKAKLDDTSNLQDNRSTGGMSLAASFGGLWTQTSWNYGADLTYFYLFDREFDDAINTEFSGGNTFKIAGFGEYNHGAGFAGLEVSYNIVDEFDTKTDTGTTSTDAENILRIALYGTWEFTDLVTGLVRLEQSAHEGRDVTPNAGELKSYSETSISVGARLNF